MVPAEPVSLVFRYTVNPLCRGRENSRTSEPELTAFLEKPEDFAISPSRALFGAKNDKKALGESAGMEYVGRHQNLRLRVSLGAYSRTEHFSCGAVISPGSADVLL